VRGLLPLVRTGSRSTGWTSGSGTRKCGDRASLSTVRGLTTNFSRRAGSSVLTSLSASLNGRGARTTRPLLKAGGSDDPCAQEVPIVRVHGLRRARERGFSHAPEKTQTSVYCPPRKVQAAVGAQSCQTAMIYAGAMKLTVTTVHARPNRVAYRGCVPYYKRLEAHWLAIR